MAIYFVHTGTGTFFDANDGVYLLDTSDIPAEALEQAMDDLDNDMATDVALEYGEKIEILRKGNE